MKGLRKNRSARRVLILAGLLVLGSALLWVWPVHRLLLAQVGHADSQYIYRRQLVMLGRVDSATAWLEAAALRGDMRALALLTSLVGSERLSGPVRERFTTYLVEAEDGNTDAMLMAGLGYMHGVYGRKADVSATYWIERSAALGNPEAVRIR